MNQWESVSTSLARERRTWLITGVAGFIGSHLLQGLLELDQRVVGADNFSTGSIRNLEEVSRAVGPERWSRFRLVGGDLRHPEICEAAVKEVDHILHQAAIGSVPRSIERPVESHENNLTATVNLFHSAVGARVRSVVFASSSAVYGDCRESSIREAHSGGMLSPYAVTKKACESYAEVFQRCYRLPIVALRYFNVFGPRQDPNGAYAAVIPRWIEAILSNMPLEVYGDGETSRDFCSVKDVVRANVLAAVGCTAWPETGIFNVGTGRSTTLNQLISALKIAAVRCGIPVDAPVVSMPERPGDIRNSCADIGRIRERLGFEPKVELQAGLLETMTWFRRANVDRDGRKPA